MPTFFAFQTFLREETASLPAPTGAGSEYEGISFGPRPHPCTARRRPVLQGNHLDRLEMSASIFLNALMLVFLPFLGLSFSDKGSLGPCDAGSVSSHPLPVCSLPPPSDAISRRRGPF